MSRVQHRLLLIACGLAAVPLAPAVATAQSGWLPTSWFGSGQVDPKAMYPLAEKDGPWLVLAATFRGETAREDARKLVHELRGRSALAAYTHEKAFDFSGSLRGVGLNPDGSPKTMRYANQGQVIEVAVLVGDFASADDPRAQKTLQKVKELRPESLGGKPPKGSLMADFIKANSGLAPRSAEMRPPLHAAMLIPNPLLPEDYFNRQEVDDFVAEMNADVTYSLLDCPTRYTVRVATFSGAGTFAQQGGSSSADGSQHGIVDVGRFVAALRGNGWQNPQVRGLPAESLLVEAAEQAHRLTVALRKRGWQAWEFHDRDESIVCVGGIDQLAVPGADGRPQVHPEITRIVAGLGPDQAALAAGQILPRSFDGIMLDVQPKPIDVPRAPPRRRGGFGGQ